MDMSGRVYGYTKDLAPVTGQPAKPFSRNCHWVCGVCVLY